MDETIDNRIKRWEKQDSRYVLCDDPDCKALAEPTNYEEALVTIYHLNYHGFLNGCSHGC